MSDNSKARPPRTKRSKIKVKYIFLCLLILVIAGTAVTAFIPVTHWVFGTGYIITSRDAEIRPPLEATIEKWLVNDGSLVKKNQPIIQLASTVETAALESAKNELETAKAKLKSLQASLELQTASLKQQKYRAQRVLEQAEKDLQSMKTAPANVFSPKEFDDAKLRRDNANSMLRELSLPQDELLKKQIDIAREEVETAVKKVCVRQAEVDMRQICASIDGTVYFNRFDEGEVVKPSDVLGQIFDKTEWVVRLKIAESDLRYVRLEQRVEIEVSGFWQIRYGYLMGKVCKITPVVSPQMTGSGVFTLKAMIDDPHDKRLNPGVSVTAWVNVGEISLLRKILGLY
ncbi:MAG TPA: HlyD family efflux transporter periplasmic adaptor subunit [Phycisphaerae bacterium]|nr:HlyD family efflux transporter periplasmic adaptor subunit [Phycisphaerae bacterium]